ncbi:MAG TPA: ABC transporter substrate-binding protein [Castellaniella sp.]|uniref:ABC transporter substrate-binding protein n=1 Tax=Castellaniella sp. TaxID=1955812 RepID=UPI002EFD6B15
MIQKLSSLLALGAVALCFQAGPVNAEEFTVGVDLPLTGHFAKQGLGQMRGIKIAVEAFKEASGGKDSIKLITIDNESQPAKSVAAVEKLASQGVIAITGGYGSNVVSPASEAANKLGVPYVSSGAIADSLTKRGLKYYFQILNTDGYSKPVIELIKTFKVKSVSLIYSTAESTSALAKDAQKGLTAAGVKVMMHEYEPSTTNFTPIVNKVRLQDKPDILLMVGYQNEEIGILRAAKLLKPTVKAVVGTYEVAVPEMVTENPDLVQNVFGLSLLSFPAEFPTPDGKKFSTIHRALFPKEDFGYIEEYGYAGAKVVFDALLKAQAAKEKITHDSLRDIIAKTDEDTVLGKIRFDAGGLNTEYMQHIGQIQGKKVVIVWPDDQATGKMVYPGLPW